MQYASATLANVVTASPSYAWISSSGASAPQDTPRPAEGMDRGEDREAFFGKLLVEGRTLGAGAIGWLA